MSDLALYTGTLNLPANATWWSCMWGAVTGIVGAVVTGSGTTWLTQISVGQNVSFANQSGTGYVVLSVDSNTQVTLTATFTGPPGATSMGFVADPVFCCDGESRLRGYVYSSVSSTGYVVQCSQDGVNWDVTITLVADPSGNTYSFDINLVGQPFFRLVVTDTGGGSSDRILFYTIDDGSGPNILGGTTPPPSQLGTPIQLANQPTNSNGATNVALLSGVLGQRVYPSDLVFTNNGNIWHLVSLVDASTGNILQQFRVAAGQSYPYRGSNDVKTAPGGGLSFHIDATGNLNDVAVTGCANQG